MRDASLEEFPAQFLELGLILGHERKGESAGTYVSGRTFACRVDKLCCLNTVGKISPCDAIVGCNLYPFFSGNGRNGLIRSYPYLVVYGTSCPELPILLSNFAITSLSDLMTALSSLKE